MTNRRAGHTLNVANPPDVHPRKGPSPPATRAVLHGFLADASAMQLSGMTMAKKRHRFVSPPFIFQ
jgi:hypothetical protein